MKYSYLLLVLFLIILFSAVDAAWVQPSWHGELEDEAGYDYVFSSGISPSSYSGKPSIAVDSTNMYVVWEDDADYNGSGSDADIMFIYCPLSTMSCSNVEVVSTESSSDSNRPFIAVDSANIYVAWEDMTDWNGSGSDYDIFFKYKPISELGTNNNWNAQSWLDKNTFVISNQSSANSFRVELEADGTNVYAVWEDMTDYNSAGSDWDIFFKYKPVSELGTDNNWSVLTEVASNGARGAAISGGANPAINVDSTNVYLIWWASATSAFFKYKPLSELGTNNNWDLNTFLVSTESEFSGSELSGNLSIDADTTNIYVTWNSMVDYLNSGGADTDIFFKYKPISELGVDNNWNNATELVANEGESNNHQSGQEIRVKNGILHIVTNIGNDAGAIYRLVSSLGTDTVWSSKSGNQTVLEFLEESPNETCERIEAVYFVLGDNNMHIAYTSDNPETGVTRDSCQEIYLLTQKLPQWNYNPDANVTLLDSVAAEQYGNLFSYSNDQNITIDFNIMDADNAAIDVDICYSTAVEAAGSCGTSIISISNIQNTSVCDDTNFQNSTHCSWDWNISGIGDGNYFIDVNIQDGNIGIIGSSYTFIVDNNAPDTSSDVNSGWQTTDANVILSCLDGSVIQVSAIASGEYNSCTSEENEDDVETGCFAFGDYESDRSTQFLVFPLNIPAGVTLADAYIRFLLNSGTSLGNGFTTAIELLEKDGTWENSGVTSDDYTYASALAISANDINASYEVSSSLLVGAWANIPSITSLVQAFIDSGTYFLGDNIGFRIGPGDSETDEFFNAYSNDDEPATDSPPKIVTTYNSSSANSGCSLTQYRIDSDATSATSYLPWAAFDTNLLITSDGNWAIDYNSTDGEGQIETTNRAYVLIDKTAPNTPTITKPSSGADLASGVFTAHFSATDATSGVKQYWVKVDTGDWRSTTDANLQLSVTTTGSHILYVKSQDNADNNSATSATVTFSVEKLTAPYEEGEVMDEQTQEYELTDEQIEELITELLDGQLIDEDTAAKIKEYAKDLVIERRMTVRQQTTGSYTTTFTLNIINNTGKNLENVMIIETVPKTVAATADEIVSIYNFTVLKQDPIIEFNIPVLMAGEVATVNYAVDKQLSVALLDDFSAPLTYALAELIITPPSDLCNSVVCNDENPCTRDYCEEGDCFTSQHPNGTICGKGQVCKEGTCTELKTGSGGDNGGAGSGWAPPEEQQDIFWIGLVIIAVLLAGVIYYFYREE